MIRFEHTLFALPFAYMGAVLAARGLPPPFKLLWITLAMIGGRSAGMTFNRIIDKEIDAKNPRTANRAIPRGLISVEYALVFAGASLVLYFFSAYQLNWLCFLLSPIPAVLFIFYHYTKRYTWLCHVVLGSVLALAPMGGWVAVSGSLDVPPILLGLSVALWVAGFDIVYACTDVDFDKRVGLHSVPRKFGIKASLNLSKVLHAATLLLLLATGLLLELRTFYWIGLLLSAAVLAYEHALVASRGLAVIGETFLNINGLVSVSMLISAALGVYL